MSSVSTSKCNPVLWLGSLFLLVLLCILPGCGEQKALTTTEVQKRGKLIAGVKYDSKPFGFMDANGKLQGYDIDLMRELARRLLGDGQKVEFQQVLSSTRVIALNAGNVDVVGATMTITPDREKVIDFSIPYYTAHQAVIVPQDSQVRKLDDLHDKAILFVIGTTSEMNIRRRLPNAKYIGYKSSTDAFSALKARRGDAMTTDDSIIFGFLSDNCGYRLLDERLSDEPYGLAFRQATVNTAEGIALRDQVNRYLREMHQDGTLDRLKAKWIDTILQQEKSCSHSP
jgi:aspartate/glutamate/glutamine transport system substrate-binding protein